MIELTLDLGGQVWINYDEISSMWRGSLGQVTYIRMKNGGTHDVLQIPEVITEMASNPLGTLDS